MAVGFSFCKSGITLVLGPFFSPAIFNFSGEGRGGGIFMIYHTVYHQCSEGAAVNHIS